MEAELEILRPGLFSTVQDRGRFGFMKYGIPISGAMDSFSSAVANLMLRNPSDAAVLELTQSGPKLGFSHPTQIVISGARLSPQINGESVENNRVVAVRAGDILSFGKRIFGCRAYLAVKGGFQTEQVLGSRSWYGSVTSWSKIEKGMKLPYHSMSEISTTANAVIKPDEYLTSDRIECFRGPEFHLLPEKEKNLLVRRTFTIGPNSNRMGIQLEEKLQNSLKPMITVPILPGTVQLTPSGKLIVILRDGQTTGGYPRILHLSERGISTISQKVMGENFSFYLD